MRMLKNRNRQRRSFRSLFKPPSDMAAVFTRGAIRGQLTKTGAALHATLGGHQCILPRALPLSSSRPPVSPAAGGAFRCMTTSGAAIADEEYQGDRLTENEARPKSEVDAAIIFDNVWAALVAKYGEEGLNFPQGAEAHRGPICIAFSHFESQWVSLVRLYDTPFVLDLQTFFGCRAPQGRQGRHD
jgi:hypothetical protein